MHLIRSDSIRSVAVAATAVAAIIAACSVERADVRTPSGEAPEADSTRVRKVVEDIADAFRSGDIVALDTVFHDSVTVYEGGRVDRGWMQYRNEHLAPEINALSDRSLSFEDIRVRLAGSTAWVTCRYSISGSLDGEPVEASGVSTMIFQKLAGRWRLVHWHTSSRGG